MSHGGYVKAGWRRIISRAASATPAAWFLSANRKLSTLAVTAVNSLLSHAPPFSLFFCIGPKLRCIRSTATASESMSENDVECFASRGVNSLQTPCSTARTRDIHRSCQAHALVVRVAQADGGRLALDRKS